MARPTIAWRPLLRHVPRLALAVIALIVIWRTPNFLTLNTFGTILALGSIVGVMALGQACVLIAGGFDLSQGAILALCAAVAAMLSTRTHIHPAAIAALALGAGAILGSLNGLVVAGVGASPFVTTLSTQMIYRGATFVLLQGGVISNVRVFHLLSDGPVWNGTLIPIRGFVFLALALIGWFVLKRTVFGRHLYAVGGNERAARLSGLPTMRLRVATFAISGATCGLAALMMLSWVYSSKANTGFGMELDSIAACVVGGISLQGGSGSMLGAASGCLLLQLLDNCITRAGWLPEYRSIATGATLLVFAGFDALSRKFR